MGKATGEEVPFSSIVKFLFCLIISLASAAVTGCGSGGSGTGTGTSSGGGGQSSPDFSISLSPASVSLTAGATATTTVSVTAINGFNSTVTLAITGLPSGVTFSPSTLQATPSSPAQITFTAASSAVGATTNLTITGTSGSVSHNTNLALTINIPSTYSSRTRYTRTDSATEYSAWLNQNWMVYDPPTNRFFVSDPSLNRIVVLDPVAEKEIGTIAVPGALGIDETPDHSKIYACTAIGDVYAIDPVGMQVTQRYLASQIGPSGYKADSVRVLDNAELALIGGPGGADGYASVAVWNPTSNAITIYGGSSPFCVTHIGAFTLTGDRSLIVVGSVDSDHTLCTLNPVTGQQNSVTAGVSGFLWKVTPTPDGKSLLLPTGSEGVDAQVVAFNAQTLAQTSAFSVAGDTSSASSMIVSPDSQTLYIGDGGGMLYAYDLASGTLAGWLPNLMVNYIEGGSAYGPTINPSLQAFDNTGLLAGPMEEGVGFLDTTTLRTGPVGSEFVLLNPLSPATGATGGGTQTEWQDASQSAKMTAAYFGGNAATSISQTSTDFYATTPAGSAGPADLYAPTSDGGLLIFPEAFSYGPTVLEVTPGAATAEGGGTGVTFGYGFGSTAYNSPIPSGLQISVGGKPATVTGYAGNAYNLDFPPFPLESVTYTIPAGAAGTSSDVTVTASSGSATAPSALQYLPAVQQFPLSGAVIAQGVYDSTQDLYYFTDASQIRVFSRTQGQWLPSIQVPAAPAGTTHRLWGIALSPDNSKLAISDQGTGTIYLINPSTPTSVQSFPITYSGSSLDPAGLAISNSGTAYFATSDTFLGSNDCFFKLDTTSGQITAYSILGTPPSPLFRTTISADNSKVFFNDDGAVLSIDTATDAISYATVGYGDYDLTLSSNQSALEAASYLYDTSLDANSYLALNDREALDITYVYGTKFSPDGTLLFQPSTNGIDVYDGRLGILLSRISLPFDLSQNFDALVSDGKDNVLVAVTGQTGSGIAIVDLSSVPEPAPLPYYLTQRTNTASATWLLRQTKSPSNNSSWPRKPTAAIKHVAKSLVPTKSAPARP